MSIGKRTAGSICLVVSLALGQAAAARDMMDPIGTVNAFQAAVANGDEGIAKNLLAPDVLIYESGGQERSRDEYTSHHMKGDMAFLGKAQIQRLDQKQHGHADLAVVSTRSRITGQHKDKAVDIHSTETMVLKRIAGGWQIVHIHWSSRPVEPKAP